MQFTSIGKIGERPTDKGSKSWSVERGYTLPPEFQSQMSHLYSEIQAFLLSMNIDVSESKLLSGLETASAYGNKKQRKQAASFWKQLSIIFGNISDYYITTL